eukprot:TRINITY_DN6797_c0_g1_i1.p1 TRINITY_DN6797_c0_g1~~TRINITY_DN6797_c0_g1_i1.p1  ORF type:complete len:152 (-),score=8.17 TRINITY_DN6797_c0_g1_i1:200-655(-)
MLLVCHNPTLLVYFFFFLRFLGRVDDKGPIKKKIVRPYAKCSVSSSSSFFKKALEGGAGVKGRPIHDFSFATGFLRHSEESGEGTKYFYRTRPTPTRHMADCQILRPENATFLGAQIDKRRKVANKIKKDTNKGIAGLESRFVKKEGGKQI